MLRTRLLGLSLLLLLLAPAVLAFTWSEYAGTSQWRVAVTEDETDCGGGKETETITVSIQHQRATASADFGHGKASGAFQGNTLRIPSRTIPDGRGSSELSEAVIPFTPDCRSFSTTYGWYYKDDYQQCGGTTTLKGTRTDAAACPGGGGFWRTQVYDARADPDDASKERQYQEILREDPTNFWANWDMAELRMKQGKSNDYFKYLDKAASNEKNFQETREALKKEAANQLGLTRFPTDKVSPLLRAEKDELDNWQESFTPGSEIPPPPSHKEAWPVYHWRRYVPDPGDIPWRIAALPPEE